MHKMNKKEEKPKKTEEREKVSYPVQKEQLLLKSSYEMYENTIRDTREHMMAEIDENTGNRRYSDKDIESRINLIKEAEKDIIDRFIQNGGTLEELKKSLPHFKKKKSKIDKTIMEKLSEASIDEEKELRNVTVDDKKNKVMESFIPSSHTFNPQATFDIIPLPSKGECYPDKIDKLPVSYLTAYDENIIVSPNLYRENLVIDYILHEKIMNDSIDPSKLLDGDRDAIILYLRAAGYGNDYPITVVDDITGQKFDTTVDLSKLGFKEFSLKGDENGLFDFELPETKHKIKFRFLNHFDKVSLEKINELEKKDAYKGKIIEMSETLDRYLDNMDKIDASEKIAIREHNKKIKEWAETIEDGEDNDFSHSLTNKLELSIMSVDGDKDRENIRKFVNSMNVKDSTALRRYITNNEPGVDFNIEVERPESLGGGSMKVFLELDQFIFLNIS